jgi:DNA-directed RNA polymerase II subunit RPB1
MTARLVPASGAIYVDSSTVVSRQLYPRIASMRFGLLSPDEIEQLATRVITQNTVYAKNLPKLNGPNDPALGPCDRRVLCSTCRNDWFHCPGHEAVIRLPITLLHVLFVDPTFKVLQCVCWNCSKLLGDMNDARLKVPMSSIDRFALMFSMGKGRYKCPFCAIPQPKYKKTGMSITREWNAKKLDTLKEMDAALHAAAIRRFTPADILDIFKNISDEHCVGLGLDPKKSHPSWMLLQNLAVLPPNARPAIMAAEGSKRRGQDDITSQTQDIVKACQILRKAIQKSRDETLNPGVKSTRSGNKRSREKDDGIDDEEEGEDSTSAIAQALSVAEFSMDATSPYDFTVADVEALRFALPQAVLTPSATQVAAIWDQFPLLCEKLQNSVAMLFDNSGKYATQTRTRTGGPKKALINRWTGKGGRMRGNCVAKRVDMSARTVIIPDAFLDVDELGIPSAFAVILTIQEDVNMSNIDRLLEAVRRGHGMHGGASKILHVNGQMTQLQGMEESSRKSIRIQVGDAVERHLLNGDRVVFNRQPSLHKLSVMVHRIRLIKGMAIAVPLAVVEPYNADFDGDEMNLHVLQSMLANAEAVELMSVSRNVMNPQTNEPCLSLVQDVRVGGMLLTANTTFLTERMMHQCVGVIHYPIDGKERIPPPCKYSESGEPMWSGKQLVSMLLPPIFIEKRVRGADADVGKDDPKERYVLIENGVLLYGKLCKATLGTSTGGITHRICTQFGQDAAVRFLSDFQRVVYMWLPEHGLTMGLSDCLVSDKVKSQIKDSTQKLDTLVSELTREAVELKPHMTSTEYARAEAFILTTLTSILDYASRLVLEETENMSTGFNSMVEAGSKGNINNIAQVMAALGQQVVNGQRVDPSASCHRTLPMFPEGAMSAAARGFIMNSYLTGMEPYEYFNHMQGGREGLVATAVKTAETGYKYRSMAKGQETNLVQWDGSVRNAQGYIIEFIAGGDCMDPTKVERVNLEVIAMSNAQVREAMAGGDVSRVMSLRNRLRQAFLTPLYRELNTKVLIPLNIKEEIRRIKYGLNHRRARFEADSRPSTDEEYQQAVSELIQDLTKLVPSPEAILSLELCILYECRPSALREAGINAHTFIHVLGVEIKQRTTEALVQPGESVGIIAAQSIGEPSTQFTLDAFHQAGLVQRRMTVGVPRLKELLHASERIQTPSMVIPFRDKSVSREEGNRLARSLQFLCVDYVLYSSYVQFDPPGDGVTSPLTNMYKDHGLMEHTANMYCPESELIENTLSPWVIRLVLNRSVLTEHYLTPEDVARQISKQITDVEFVIVYSQPNMSHWILRIRPLGDTTEGTCRKLHSRVRQDVLLGGINGIKDSRIIDMKRSVIHPETGEVSMENTMVIDTGGSALMKVATREWADWENTVTNDVQEVASTLGIVAARALLFAELDRVISYDGGYVDPRHLRALTNSMTHRGYIMSMTRHGINRVDFSVLQRASYEEPVDMILQAALTAEKDDLNGMCQCILAGQKVPVGTGTVSISIDVERDGLSQFGRQRTTLSSREQRGLSIGRKNKRLRQDLTVKGKHFQYRKAYHTPEIASKAWEDGEDAKPARAVNSLPSSIQEWTLKLSGIVITTNDVGLYETTKSPDTSIPIVIEKPGAYRPSSPTDLFDDNPRPHKLRK